MINGFTNITKKFYYRGQILYVLLFFFLDKKETKNQENLISAAQTKRHRRFSILTRSSEKQFNFKLRSIIELSIKCAFYIQIILSKLRVRLGRTRCSFAVNDIFRKNLRKKFSFFALDFSENIERRGGIVRS